jgi:O-antigen ligase
MYEETFSIVRENPLFGVGMGGWEQAYSRFRTPQLAGLRPVYAHSEPVQLLAETGVIGFSLLGALVVCLTRYGWRAVSRLGGSPETAVYATHTKGLIAGLIAFVVGTFFDFSFRMPAITFMVAVYVGLLSYYIDLASQKPSSDG